jgi:hypothetical protein
MMELQRNAFINSTWRGQEQKVYNQFLLQRQRNYNNCEKFENITLTLEGISLEEELISSNLTFKITSFILYY